MTCHISSAFSAHKYHISSVQDQEICALQESCLTSDFNVHFGPPNPQISMESVHYMGVDTPLMLPLPLYRCCYLGGKLLDGWTREDGTVEYLSPEDVERCFNARIVLSRREVLLVSRLLDAVPR